MSKDLPEPPPEVVAEQQAAAQRAAAVEAVLGPELKRLKAEIDALVAAQKTAIRAETQRTDHEYIYASRKDLDAIEHDWLRLCGPCDAGTLDRCTCPPGDHRAVIQRLVAEVRRLQGTTLTVPDTPKMIRETLCVAATALGYHPYHPDRAKHMAQLQRLINECDRHRPLGPDGKHGSRHTTTCGCKDGEENHNDEPDPY